MIGYINRANVMGSWRGHLHAESVRENGWLKKVRSISDHAGDGGVSIGRVKFLTDNRLLLTPNSHSTDRAEDFTLSAPLRGVFLGDEVRVSYRSESCRKVATRVEELSSRQ